MQHSSLLGHFLSYKENEVLLIWSQNGPEFKETKRKALRCTNEPFDFFSENHFFKIVFLIKFRNIADIFSEIYLITMVFQGRSDQQRHTVFF